jgi:Na+-transporting methylmalonyl-CoA/oxaloacetate decarboxylase gamma subunit
LQDKEDKEHMSEPVLVVVSGLCGVFVVMVLLQIFIVLSSKIAQSIDRMNAKKETQEG